MTGSVVARNILYGYSHRIINLNPTPASFYVLLALSRGPGHGLAIADDVATFTDGAILLGPATLYRCLKELTDAGAIERTNVQEEPSNGHRKHYQLTDSGEAEIRLKLGHLDRVLAVGADRVRVPDARTRRIG